MYVGVFQFYKRVGDNIADRKKVQLVHIFLLYNRSMQTLREAIAAYKARGKAIGHFNFSDSNQLKAIAFAAKEARVPVIAGLSEGEREYFPLSHARALV